MVTPYNTCITSNYCNHDTTSASKNSNARRGTDIYNFRRTRCLFAYSLMGIGFQLSHACLKTGETRSIVGVRVKSPGTSSLDWWHITP